MPAIYELQRAERYRRLAGSETDGMKAEILLRLAAEAERGMLRAAQRVSHIRVVQVKADRTAAAWFAWHRYDEVARSSEVGLPNPQRIMRHRTSIERKIMEAFGTLMLSAAEHVSLSRF